MESQQTNNNQERRKNINLVNTTLQHTFRTNPLQNSKAILTSNIHKNIKQLFLNTPSAPQLESLYLHWNNSPSIIYDINHTKFEKLRIINIGGNQLTTIDQLNYSQMPNLQELFLWSNSISNIKAISRLYTNKLKTIDLSRNVINNVQQLSDVLCENLKRINLESTNITSVNYLNKILLLRSSFVEVRNTKLLTANGFNLSQIKVGSVDKFFLREKKVLVLLKGEEKIIQFESKE